MNFSISVGGNKISDETSRSTYGVLARRLTAEISSEKSKGDVTFDDYFRFSFMNNQSEDPSAFSIISKRSAKTKSSYPHVSWAR